MTACSIAPELVAALKRLRLGGLLPTLPERIALAEKDGTAFDDLPAKRRSCRWPTTSPSRCSRSPHHKKAQ